VKNHEAKMFYFLREHMNMTRLVTLASDQFVCRILFVLLLVTIPNNFLLNHRTVFRGYPIPGVGIFVNFVMLSQVLVFAIALVPMARANSAFYRISKLLPRILQNLKSQWLKLKVENLYDGLTESDRKIGLCFAPGLIVTYSAIFRV